MSASHKITSRKSEQLFTRAVELLPGGVNSPVRAFKSVGGTPRFIARAKGATLTDVDGREYIDHIGSWGPMILGHAHPEVIAEIADQLAYGTSYGAPSEPELELAEEIIRRVPSVEMVRMTSSGTEAVISAVRLARGATGRTKLVKFEGCYHGHVDSLLVKAGSGVATLGLPDSPGVPASLASETVAVGFNDIAKLEEVFDQYPSEIAAVILEPVVGNSGLIAPAEGYLAAVRDITRKHNTLLIFDEVMTGFRLARGGAQELYGVMPDITTMGKIIGGGLPVGAYGASKEIMRHIAPAGSVYQAGTLSGNPLAMRAGLATLRRLDAAAYEKLERTSARLVEGIRDAAREAGIKTVTNRVGSMWTTFFTATPVTDWATADTCDRESFGRFFHHMLDAGIYLAPSQFEAHFVSLAHTDEQIESTIAAARTAFGKLAG